MASALCQLERFCPMFDVVHRSFFWSVFLTLTAGFLFVSKLQKKPSRRGATVDDASNTVPPSADSPNSMQLSRT